MRGILAIVAAAVLMAVSPVLAQTPSAVASGSRRTTQKQEVNHRNPDGSTPLQWAVYNGDVNEARRLLRAGANVMTVNFTPDEQRDRYLIYGRDRFVVRRDYAGEVIARAGLTRSGSVFLDAESRTAIDGGDPKELRDHSPHAVVRDFLSRGEAQNPGP